MTVEKKYFSSKKKKKFSVIAEILIMVYNCKKQKNNLKGKWIKIFFKKKDILTMQNLN